MSRTNTWLIAVPAIFLLSTATGSPGGLIDAASAELDAGGSVELEQKKDQSREVVKKWIIQDAGKSKWVTYENKKYGFKIKHPKDAVLNQGKYETCYLLGDNWRADSAEANTGEDIVGIVFYNYQKCEHSTVELRIGASSNPKDVKDCLKPGYYEAEDPEDGKGTAINHTVKINNLAFFNAFLNDAGMSHSMIGESYRIIHENTCFAIEVINTSSGRGACDPIGDEDKMDKNISFQYDQALKAVKTLKFIK